MSRIIELSKTVINKPELLEEAVKSLNDLKKYKVINAKFTQDETGRITGGIFHYATEGQSYGRGHVMLRYHGKGKPVYTPEGVLENGHFTLMGDEDFRETRDLGILIGDHYSAQVVRETLESTGHRVEINVGQDGAIAVDGYIEEGLAACSW